MAIQTLSSRTSLDSLMDELLYTLARLRARSDTAKYVSNFEVLLSDLKKAQQSEQSLREQILSAEALVDSCDDELDDRVDLLNNALLKLTQNSRTDSLYQRYFGTQRPSELKKPILGEELEIVRSWLDSLKTSTHKELQDLAKAFADVVSNADKAVAALREARAKYADFRTTGAREQIFEHVNAERKQTYGALSTLSHGGTAKQSADFADRFFLHRRTTKRPDPESSAQLKTRIDETAATMKELQTRYEEALALEAEEVKQQQERELDLKALEQTEQEVQKMMKKMADLKKKLG